MIGGNDYPNEDTTVTWQDREGNDGGEWESMRRERVHEKERAQERGNKQTKEKKYSYELTAWYWIVFGYSPPGKPGTMRLPSGIIHTRSNLAKSFDPHFDRLLN